MATMRQPTVSPLSLLRHLPERSSPSRVRFAAQNRRALDRSGPFYECWLIRGKVLLWRLPLVGYARISLADLVNWKEFTM